jgi:hypothetical protein
MKELQPKVALRLMAGQEANAVATVLAAAHPSATVEYYPAYISVEGPGQLSVQISQIGEALGSDYDVTRFLVILSSYVGTINVYDDSVVLTAA